ncbi:MAG: DNA polymerase III subunit beta [Epulopiscium sp.]|nr:DNA polymerase III subunit beta [Candidatus Epulonipiscium sp.]
MHIRCQQEILLESVNTVLKAVSNRTTLPILECILIQTKNDKLVLVGNDLELGIESTIASDILEPGYVALEAKIFSEIIRKLPNEEIEISVDENYMTTIRCHNSKFQIAGQSGDDFPELPKVEKLHGVTLPQPKLKDIIRQTHFSIAQEETRPILTGALMQLKDDGLNMVTVDGYRISYRHTDLSIENDNVNVVVPGKTLGEISKILSTEDTDIVTIFFTDKHVLFDLGSSTVVSRLLEGEFLRYEQSFSSDYETKVLIDRNALLLSIERAALISREGKKNPIKIQLTSDKMIITSNTDLGTAREEITASLDGKDLLIAFNPKYLIEALKAIDDDQVEIYFISSLAPCIIQPVKGNDFKYLILPIRLSA